MPSTVFGVFRIAQLQNRYYFVSVFGEKIETHKLSNLSKIYMELVHVPNLSAFSVSV